MKKLNQAQFNKHLKHAYKNATIQAIEMEYNKLDKDITYKTIKLSNDIEIKKTYFQNILRYIYINKKTANDLNCYHIKNGYIEKA